MILLSGLLISCTHTEKQGNTQIKKVINFEQYKQVIAQNKDKLLVVNFWATWCAPCVEELPHFKEVNDLYNENLYYKMIFVSLDKAETLNTDMLNVANKFGLANDLYILDDNTRMNEWIPAIDSSWSGAIPATIFYQNGEKVQFNEGQLSKSELILQINNYL